MRRWLRVVLAWGPSAALIFAVMLAWNAFWAGDSVSAVMTLVVLPLLLPSVAVCWLLIVVVSAIRTRTWTLWRSFAALVTVGALFPALWNVQVAQLVFPADPEATESLSVRLPLEGEVVVGWGGDTLSANYHAAYPSQRWAYDLLVEPYGLGSDNLEDYGCYGMPVLAPVDGRVVSVASHEPDQGGETFTPNYSAPFGNVVWIEPEQGGFLCLAHLMPGHVMVSEGDTVEEGQQIGRCGNSGNTSEPHVHMHYQRDHPDEGPFSVGRPLFFRDHSGPDRPEGGLEVRDGQLYAMGDRVSHVDNGR